MSSSWNSLAAATLLVLTALACFAAPGAWGHGHGGMAGRDSAVTARRRTLVKGSHGGGPYPAGGQRAANPGDAAGLKIPINEIEFVTFCGDNGNTLQEIQAGIGKRSGATLRQAIAGTSAVPSPSPAPAGHRRSLIGRAASSAASASRKDAALGDAATPYRHASRRLQGISFPVLGDPLFKAEISVHWHITRKSTESWFDDGDIPEESILQQMALLNEIFSNAGFSFVNAGIERVTNDTLFYAGDDLDPAVFYGEHVPALLSLRDASSPRPQQELHVYTLYMPDWGGGEYLGGDFTYPWKAEGVRDYVLLDYTVLPGTDSDGLIFYDYGMQLVHYVGHWLGLYHPYEYSVQTCDTAYEGDRVADTPLMLRDFYNIFTCALAPDDPPEEIVDSCPNEPGVDPVANFMTENTDYCYLDGLFNKEDYAKYGFTQQQVLRMQHMWAAYRYNK